MNSEMQMKCSARMQPLSSEPFISPFTKQRIQEKKSLLYTTVTVPVYV